jgi:transaldolase
VRDTFYVEGLIGPETISTMPEDTIRAFQDHGRVDLTLESDLEEAQHLFNQLYAAGVDYNVVALYSGEQVTNASEASSRRRSSSAPAGNPLSLCTSAL